MCEGDIKDCTGADVPHEPKAKRDIKDCTAADVPREPKTEGDIKDCTAADVSREPKAEGDIKDCTAANVLREPKAERDKIQDGRARYVVYSWFLSQILFRSYSERMRVERNLANL